jgi:hypothetical protein
MSIARCSCGRTLQCGVRQFIETLSEAQTAVDGRERALPICVVSVSRPAGTRQGVGYPSFRCGESEVAAAYRGRKGLGWSVSLYRSIPLDMRKDGQPGSRFFFEMPDLRGFFYRKAGQVWSEAVSPTDMVLAGRQ